jgi:hypothetical protein
LRGSFIPPAEIAAIRELARYRKKLVEARASELQRLAKVLDDSGIKIDSVASSLRCAGRTDTYVGARFRRLHRRFGKNGGKKAAVATAHTLIVIIWHVLAETTAYRDLGSDYFTRRIDRPDAGKRRLIRELEALGHQVSIEPAAA